MKTTKKRLRKYYKTLRLQIPIGRRQAAEQSAASFLKTLTESNTVLSYAPYGAEFDISQVNRYLAEHHRLILPRMEGENLILYRVPSLEKLEPNLLGIPEPVPGICPLAAYEELGMALVPGVAFDANNHRIGSGKGYYDRLLKQLNPETITCGIGFIEQKIDAALDFEEHDFSLTACYLF